ncbi:MAG: hypothetical protein IPJ01_11835 [Micavibrio sp.]|nr:hypothetical protein [Micavibrio sp.]
MSKGILYKFRKRALYYVKNGKKNYLYESDEKIKKDDLKVGNYYLVEGIKLLLYKIYPNNIDYEFKNEKNHIILYYHNLTTKFEDNKGNTIPVANIRFSEYRDETVGDNNFTLRITKPNKVYLEITPEGIIKVV